MRLLLLGGPTFVGRAVLDAALAAGHEVTMFNRGLSDASAYPTVERLIGDRDGNLEALRGREWDAAVDTCGYLPRIVRQSAELLADAVGRYVFVSTVSVYASFAAPVSESSRTAELTDPSSEDIPSDYGALKAACEETIDASFPGRALHVRAGLIVGPHDPTGRFTYWPHRVAQGGDVLVHGPRGRVTSVIDVRDLGEWIVASAPSGGPAGPVNAVNTWTLGEVLDACVEATGAAPRFIEVADDFLLAEEVGQWLELPLWIDAADAKMARFMEIDTARARATGLGRRPLADTARGALELASGKEGVGLTPEREAALLERWRARATAG
jgi:2'-hydroxyisoflavone reductase